MDVRVELSTLIMQLWIVLALQISPYYSCNLNITINKINKF